MQVRIITRRAQRRPYHRHHRHRHHSPDTRNTEPRHRGRRSGLGNGRFARKQPPFWKGEETKVETIQRDV